MRYQEEKPVAEVLEWLKQQGTPIAQRTYQNFMFRVLYLMPLVQATQLSVNADLLKAVRVRYRLAVDPKRGRVVSGKKTPWHLHSQRRRPIVVGPTPKRSAKPSPPPRPLRGDRLDDGQFPLSGRDAPPVVKEVPTRRGTPENPVSIGDWRDLNKAAREKIFSKDRNILLNYQGGIVIHMRTRIEYTPEQLVTEFGLTSTEARSCFLSL